MVKNQNYGTFRKALHEIKLMKSNREVRIIIENGEFIEQMVLRFPKLAKDIFKDLDDKSLKNCLKVSREWSKFIPNQKFSWERCIESVRRNCKLGFVDVFVNLLLFLF